MDIRIVGGLLQSGPARTGARAEEAYYRAQGQRVTYASAIHASAASSGRAIATSLAKVPGAIARCRSAAGNPTPLPVDALVGVSSWAARTAMIRH